MRESHEKQCSGEEKSLPRLQSKIAMNDGIPVWIPRDSTLPFLVDPLCWDRRDRRRETCRVQDNVVQLAQQLKLPTLSSRRRRSNENEKKCTKISQQSKKENCRNSMIMESSTGKQSGMDVVYIWVRDSVRSTHSTVRNR